MKKVAVTRVDKNEFFSDEKELIIPLGGQPNLRVWTRIISLRPISGVMGYEGLWVTRSMG